MLSADYLTSTLGIRQKGDQVLETVCTPFQLPEELEEAGRIAAQMAPVLDAVLERHPSPRGLGLAASQLGFTRRLAAVRPPGYHRFMWMINPEITSQSENTYKDWEGCLSFYDVRGQVPRPAWITLRYVDLEGIRQECRLEHQAARITYHEIDHLDGVLYTDRMERGDKLIPLAQYREMFPLPAPENGPE